MYRKWKINNHKQNWCFVDQCYQSSKTMSRSLFSVCSQYPVHCSAANYFTKSSLTARLTYCIYFDFTWNLLIYLSRYKLPWSQAATCYYQSSHSKLEAIPLVTCHKQGLPQGHARLAIVTCHKDTSKLASLSSHYPFIAECQAGKLWIPTFKVFWSDSM